MTGPAGPPVGEPLGFPKCGKCPYRLTGPARICVTCAAKSLDAIAPEACPVCSQRLEAGEACRNWLCHDPDRRIERIDAISYHTGYLQQKINSYKYDGKFGWSLILGRLLVGWLDDHASRSPPDLIVANPTHVGSGEEGPGHIETIIKVGSHRRLRAQMGLRHHDSYRCRQDRANSEVCRAECHRQANRGCALAARPGDL